MAKSKRPSSEMFHAMYERLTAEVDRITEQISKRNRNLDIADILLKGSWKASDQEGLPAQNLLAATKNLLAEPRLISTAEVEQLIGELKREMGRDAAWCWLQEQKAYQQMLKSLDRLRKSKNAGQFSELLAESRLTRAVGFGLKAHSIYIEGRLKPQQMAKEDWITAIEAVQTLKTLSQKKGLPLWRGLMNGGKGTFLPHNWLETLEGNLVRSQSAAKKKHSDEFASDRYAVRLFVEVMLTLFDAAPPILVTRFAQLIDYEADSLTDHVKYWEKVYREDLLL